MKDGVFVPLSRAITKDELEQVTVQFAVTKVSVEELPSQYEKRAFIRYLTEKAERDMLNYFGIWP